MTDDLPIIFMGLFGELSRRPLAALLDFGANVRAVIVPAARTDPDPIPLDPPHIDLPDLDFVPLVSKYIAPSIVTLAWERGIPLIAIGDFSRPAAREAIAAFEPDLICVSCFSRIIPSPILNLPKLGALNLHPSLLPRYRGPMPLFWQFRNGEPRTGVTLHYMAEQADAGDILLQKEITFPDGAHGAEVETLCADAGGELFVQALGLIRSGPPPRLPQREADSTHHPLPTRADFAISPDQPARRAFNFIRGVDSLGESLPFEIAVGGVTFRIREALEYSADTALGEPYRREGDEVRVQFQPGVLRVRAE
ncbi:MAG: hypothetical protein FJ030_07300 [Chloroflexi bacterium]|nr:hypothetical protein [Chloroflexota bacterium]